MAKPKRIIICKRCKKSRYHYGKGYCNSCSVALRVIKKSEQSPLIKCICSPDCNVMIPSIGRNGQKRYYEHGHIMKGKNHYNYKNGISNVNEYKLIYKPYYKYSFINGYVREHRYIMYLYLSILNNKITYIEDFDVHHKNKKTKDNRIENLQLISRSEHTKLEKTKDKSNRFCNLCNTNETKQWHNDINGHLCSNCCRMILRFRDKFFKK